jgi:hypothetical protein
VVLVLIVVDFLYNFLGERKKEYKESSDECETRNDQRILVFGDGCSDFFPFRERHACNCVRTFSLARE